jgi:hypothetical protein
MSAGKGGEGGLASSTLNPNATEQLHTKNEDSGRQCLLQLARLDQVNYYTMTRNVSLCGNRLPWPVCRLTLKKKKVVIQCMKFAISMLKHMLMHMACTQRRGSNVLTHTRLSHQM